MSEKWEDREICEYELPEQSEQTHASFDELRNFWAAERTVRIELEQQIVREHNACEAMAKALRRVVLMLEEYVEDEPQDDETLNQARSALALYCGNGN